MSFNPSAHAASAARALVLALSIGATMPAHSQPADAFTPRLTTPRLAPVKPEDRTQAQKDMLEKLPDANIFKTLAHHPGFCSPPCNTSRCRAGSVRPQRDALHS